MVKKAFLKGSIFVVILFLIILTLNSLFIIKTNNGAKLTQGLYTYTGDAFDVVLLGSSHMEALINPNILWNQYGITSFDYATGGQPIDVTYYLLKEILKKHNNPIVVVDLYYLGSTYKFADEGYTITALDNLKLSINKVQAIINCSPQKEWLNYIFPIFKYHDRWKVLTEKDFNLDTSETYYKKGFVASHYLYGRENTSNSSTTEMANLPPRTEEYLNKIIDLSKKEGFKLIFTNAPHDYNQTTGSKKWVTQPAKMFNKVAEITKNNNIPFINYNKMLNEIGFNFKTDMVNIGHLNIYGSTKVTLNLGEYLKNNYQLTDHRNDPKDKNWNSDYILNSHTEAAVDITNEFDIKKYTSLIKNKDYVIVACSNVDNISENLGLKEALSQFGLKLESKNNIESNFLEVINDNKVQSEMLSSSKLSKTFKFDKDINLKVSTRSGNDNMPSIILNGVECLNKENKTNVIVYDKLSKKVIDNIYLDSNNKIKRE